MTSKMLKPGPWTHESHTFVLFASFVLKNRR